MPIIIKIGRSIQEIFWAIVALLGVVLTSSGFFSSISGVTNFGNIDLTNSAAISHISGGIVIFILGLVVVAAGYFGIRGRIIITTVEDSRQSSLSGIF